MTNADLPSFLRQKTERNLAEAIHDAAQASRLSKRMDWGLDEIEHAEADHHQRLSENKEAATAGIEAHNEQLSQREKELDERASSNAAEHARVKDQNQAVLDQSEARKAATEEELALLGTLNTAEEEEDIDRSAITLNHKGSLEPHVSSQAICRCLCFLDLCF